MDVESVPISAQFHTGLQTIDAPAATVKSSAARQVRPAVVYVARKCDFSLVAQLSLMVDAHSGRPGVIP